MAHCLIENVTASSACLMSNATHHTRLGHEWQGVSAWQRGGSAQNARARYQKANARARKVILDELIAVTGYHRKHAIRGQMPGGYSSSHTLNTAIQFGSSMHALQKRAKGKFMKKVSRKSSDELRSEYKRSDFTYLVRGKYAALVAEETNVVVLEPQVARAFPNDKAVNKALRGLLRA